MTDNYSHRDKVQLLRDQAYVIQVLAEENNRGDLTAAKDCLDKTQDLLNEMKAEDFSSFTDVDRLPAQFSTPP